MKMEPELTCEDHLAFYVRWNALAGPYFEWQFSHFRPYVGRRVADLGCGVGNFAPFLLDRDLYLGIDSDPEMVDFMESAYRPDCHPNVAVLKADIASDDCMNAMRERCIDTILCVNVIEHIDDDQGVLDRMIDALPRGGTLCILVPAFQCLFGTLDELDNHFRRYSKKLLFGKLNPSVVRVVKLYYFNVLGGLGWFLKGRVLRQKAHANENYHIMSLLTSFLKRLESPFDLPFGLSLVLVARKL